MSRAPPKSRATPTRSHSTSRPDTSTRGENDCATRVSVATGDDTE